MFAGTGHKTRGLTYLNIRVGDEQCSYKNEQCIEYEELLPQQQRGIACHGQVTDGDFLKTM